MNLIFLLTISSTLFPFSMAANNWIKKFKEILHSGPKDYISMGPAIMEPSPLLSIRILLENARNSELKAVDKDGMNAAHMAAALGRGDVVELLHAKKKKLILKENNDGNKAIHVAAMCGEAAVVKFLVNVANVEVDVKSEKKKMTSLQLAAESGCVDVIKALVELKADINACDTNEGTLTPLAYAVARGHFEATKTLLELGADKEKQIYFNGSVPYSNMRPLPIAVYTLNIEISEILLTQNADTVYGDFTIVHYLSDASPVDDGGKKVEAMLDMLIEKPVRQDGVNIGKPMYSCFGGDRNIIHYTISRRNYGMFHVLIRKINEEMRPGNAKRILTELLDEKNKQGNNALNMAAEWSRWDKEMTFSLTRTEALRVGATNCYMDVRDARIIMMWFQVEGWDRPHFPTVAILSWKMQFIKRPEKFFTFCETFFKKYEEACADVPKVIATDISSLFSWYKSRNFYPFYLALQSFYSEHMLFTSAHGEGKKNRELAQKLLEEYRNHREKKVEYLLGNQKDRINYLISSKENEYLMEDRIGFANMLKEIYVWRPELEEDAFILAHLKTKLEFNSDDVKALFSDDA